MLHIILPPSHTPCLDMRIYFDDLNSVNLTASRSVAFQGLISLNFKFNCLC